MAVKVNVSKGTYRNKVIKNEQFVLLRPFHKRNGSTAIVVERKPTYSGKSKSMTITCQEKDIEVLNTRPSTRLSKIKSNTKVTTRVSAKKTKESDKQKMQRIGERFDILEQMTKASMEGNVRAMIVSGPPGIGKSFGVEKQLEKGNMFTEIANRRPFYEVVKGAMTPIGLFQTLYKHRASSQVLVFDDCDAVFQDDLSLNLLKASLDSKKKRKVYWNADSHLLRRDGIPSSFIFEGSVIFITNLKFENIRSKKLKDHLDALQSRCHYIDLTLDTRHDKFLRVKQIAERGELFTDYPSIESKESKEIINFMFDNKDKLREMSLRMALKLADLRLIDRNNWKSLARTTCMI